jgi:hypothetical protein
MVKKTTTKISASFIQGIGESSIIITTTEPAGITTSTAAGMSLYK